VKVLSIYLKKTVKMFYNESGKVYILYLTKSEQHCALKRYFSSIDEKLYHWKNR